MEENKSGCKRVETWQTGPDKKLRRERFSPSFKVSICGMLSISIGADFSSSY
jgi:hypothetical protein